MRLFSFLIVFLFFSELKSQYQLIPQPQKLILQEGEFQIPDVLLISDATPINEANYLINRLKGIQKVQIARNQRSHIHFMQINQKLHPEEYDLTITKENISIVFSSNEGYFRGLTTLAQLIEENTSKGIIPAMHIEDYPKFEWRGMHLDVVRHFFTVDEVKKYLDHLAMYKINTFHWHLTDDQGWRIEIKKYPKLIEIGSKRKESMIGPYVDQTFDGTPYGGFYTQEQIKEVVEYAKKLHITVVPEIEMPGHAVAALAAYPELSCTGGPFEVETKWGVFDDIFCPKEETFTFLEDVLTEVMALFPSEYIHIGGDEAPKTRWKECPHCQALIKNEGFKDEHELQSYFIKRIENFVNSKGRKIIGWNEILEGGLAPNAAVMSWTGDEGGIEAAKQGNYAVMTPGGALYFDHYQGDPQNEPLGFGGNNTLEKVYSYNPIPKELNEQEAKYILGAQANMWAEYILDFNHIEYMLFPRLFALSEITWGTAKPNEYQNFENRVIYHFGYLDKKGINYAKSIFNLTGNIQSVNNGIVYELKTNRNPANMRYTLNGETPTDQSLRYNSPIPIPQSSTVKSGYFENGVLKSAITSQSFEISKSTGKAISLEYPPAPNYASNGPSTLVDGVIGNPKILGKTWLGFSGKNVEGIIDLGEEMEVSEIRFNTLDNNGSWIHLASSATFSLYKSEEKYDSMFKITGEIIKQKKGQVDVKFIPQKTRYIHFSIKNAGIIPAGFPGAGSEAWLFVDEISVF